jgi:hypothetical protein
MKGANPSGLEAMIKRHAVTALPAAASTSGSSSSGTAQEKGLEGFVSFLPNKVTGAN